MGLNEEERNLILEFEVEKIIIKKINKRGGLYEKN